MEIETARNLFEGVMSCCQITMNMYEVRGQLWGMFDLNDILTPYIISQPLTACIFNMTFEGHTYAPELTSDLIHTPYDLTA